MSLPSGLRPSIAASLAFLSSLLLTIAGGAVAWAAMSNETVLNVGVTSTFSVVANATGDYVYASGISNQKIARISTSDNSYVVSPSLGNAPQSMVLSPDGSKLYVPLINADQIAVLNTSTMSVVSTFSVPSMTMPNGIAISPSGDTLFIGGYWVNKLIKMDAISGSYSMFSVGNNPQDVDISPDGATVYVTCRSSGRVDVLNAATGNLLSSVTVGSIPYSAVVAPDGSNVYAVNSGSNSVSVIDAASNTVSSTIAVGNQPRFANVSPDGSQLAVSNYASGTLMLINAINNQIVQTITPTGATSTEGVAYAALGNSLWLASQSSDRVNRWDINPPLYTPAPTPSPTPSSTTAPTLSATGLDAAPYFLISGALVGGGVIALAVALLLRRRLPGKSE